MPLCLREQRIESWCYFVAKLWRRIATQRDGANLIIGQVPDFLGNTAEPRKITVVCNHEHAVFGKLFVCFEIIRTCNDSRLHGGERVFRCLGCNATMSMNTYHASLREGFKCQPHAAATEK